MMSDHCPAVLGAPPASCAEAVCAARAFACANANACACACACVRACGCAALSPTRAFGVDADLVRSNAVQSPDISVEEM